MRLSKRLRTAVLDWRIGWNEAAKDRHTRLAEIHALREQQARAQWWKNQPGARKAMFDNNLKAFKDEAATPLFGTKEATKGNR